MGAKLKTVNLFFIVYCRVVVQNFAVFVANRKFVEFYVVRVLGEGLVFLFVILFEVNPKDLEVLIHHIRSHEFFVQVVLWFLSGLVKKMVYYRGKFPFAVFEAVNFFQSAQFLGVKARKRRYFPRILRS